MSLTSLLILAFVISAVQAQEEKLWKNVCTEADVQDLPFCDVSRALKERVDDYVGRVASVEDQINMLLANSAGDYPPLHIPKYNWWSEGLHGPLEPCVSTGTKCACPTSFPCPSGLGAAFNNTLYEKIGAAIGAEGRAISLLRPHDSSNGDGLTYWSPTINMQRDPRWGRNQEVPGEDPVLTSHYAENFVRGLQEGGNRNDHYQDGTGTGSSNSNNNLQIGACCKHFVANSLENWKNYSRHNFNAVITRRDLENYYFPAFEACTRQAVGVMCSYNALNGQPACANEWLLKTKLRQEWQFDGYVVSDCGAVGDILTGHHYVKDPEHAAAVALNATTDLNCGNGKYYPQALQEAYKKGLVDADQVTASFRRAVTVQMKLGLFDNGGHLHSKKKNSSVRNRNSSNDDGARVRLRSSSAAIDVIDSAQHRQLAYEAALQSIVLLKDKYRALPFLSPQPVSGRNNFSLAVIGPHANATMALLSNYHGSRCCGGSRDGCIQTPFQALAQGNVWGPTASVKGCNVDGEDINEIADAVALSKKSDAIVLVMGLDQSQESEGRDRVETTLPGLQVDLIRAILELQNPRTVLVLLNGGALSLGSDILERTPVIVEAFYGGQSAARALADVLFGRYNPTGKLAATMYPPSYVEDMPMTEMGLSVGLGRTHLYYKGQPEYAFGHGLSYSDWRVNWKEANGSTSDVKIPTPLRISEGNDVHEDGIMVSSVVRCDLQVHNLGPLAGHQTVLLFWRPQELEPDGGSSSPNNLGGLRQKLIGFQGTDLLPVGVGQTLTFSVRWSDFALWSDLTGSLQVSPGSYELVAVIANGIAVSRQIVAVSGTGDESKGAHKTVN